MLSGWREEGGGGGGGGEDSPDMYRAGVLVEPPRFARNCGEMYVQLPSFIVHSI